MKQFVYVQDSFLSSKICKNIIKEYDRNLEIDKNGYDFRNLDSSDFVFMSNQLCNPLEKYKKKYPEVDLTASLWGVSYLRLKKFNPDKCFKSVTEFHSEHCLSYPNRILNIQIYLTTHNCGTEFYNGDIIKSKEGRLTIFPSYFTHTHRGQLCPEKKVRYLLGGYVDFIQKGWTEINGNNIKKQVA